MPTVRFKWVESGDDVRGYQGDIPQRFLDQGRVEPDPAGLPGPAGTFRLIPEELWRTLDVGDSALVFLHESYRASIEKWVESVPQPSQEAAVIGKVRDAVGQLAESRIAAHPGSLIVGDVVTSPEQFRGAHSIIGRAIVISPAA